MPATNTCQYQDCPQSIRAGHHLCRNHYYESQGGVISACSGCGQVYKPVDYDVCRSCYGNRNLRQSEWPQPYREANQLPPELDRIQNEISQARRVIFDNPNSINDSERATEQHCVIPVLRGLGWDVHSPHEFVPQQRVTQGRRLKVDFALHIDGKPVILVEVKRHGIGYDPSWEQQLKDYIARMGMTAGFGILTNGEIWLIYHVARGNVSHIKTLDIVKDPIEAIESFQRLSRERLAGIIALHSGRNVSQAVGATAIRERPAPAPTVRPATDEELRERLRNFRITESSRRGLRPFMVFSNQTIDNIVESRPRNADDLLRISGVGGRTMDLYGDNIVRIVNSPVRMNVSQAVGATAIRERPAPAPTVRPATDEELRERLRNFRINESRRLGIPPFTVFHNQTIDNIVESRPRDTDDLIWIPGVGDRTMELYGDAIIRIVNSPVRL